VIDQDPSSWTPELVAKEGEFRRRALDLPKFDAWVIWTGPNSTCRPIPRADGDGRVKPLLFALKYVKPLMDIMEVCDARPTWLCPDVRNPLLLRDGKRELFEGRSVLAQRDYQRNLTCVDGTRLRLRYEYAGLELAAVLTETKGTHVEHKDRKSFGVIANEGSSKLRYSRKRLLKEWVLDQLGSVDVRGGWSEESISELGIHPSYAPVKDVLTTLGSWRSTITFPVHDSGWATAKAWEAFYAGTPCFAHPLYDDQDHVYGNLASDVRSFLRPKTPSELKERVAQLDNDESWWSAVVGDQFRAFQVQSKDFLSGYKKIKERLDA
jgi:hypothetical protein